MTILLIYNFKKYNIWKKLYIKGLDKNNERDFFKINLDKHIKKDKFSIMDLKKESKCLKNTDNMNLKILLGFESAKKYLKHKENVVTVGNPTNIRKLALSKEERIRIFKELGLNENIPTIVVTGGSQGARKLNESILELIKITKNKELGEKFQIIFATRKK